MPLFIGCRATPLQNIANVAPEKDKFTPVAQASAPVTAIPVRFRNVAAEAGIRFRLDNGAKGEHLFIETTTGGCAFFDYNNDGYLDIFLIQAGPTPLRADAKEKSPSPRPPCALYRNNGDGTFTDVTHEAGLDFDQGYAQGVAIADYDNDGWPDIYITAYGGNHLFHNELGHRSHAEEKSGGNAATPPFFREVTRQARVGNREGQPHWSTSAAWADFDNDGHLDLIVGNYALWSRAKDQTCWNAHSKGSYCSPDLYPGDTLTLYHNNGDGTFTDVTKKAGLDRLKGRNLGIVCLDFDADGFPDVFISNDLMPNFLLHNNRNGTFTDVAMKAGVGLMDTGVPLAGMGIGVGDYDNDGREDLIITNFSNQPKVVYRNRDGALFDNATYTSGIGTTSQRVLGWGCAMLDYDLDGYQDVVIGNGHVNDDVETYSKEIFYREPKQLFHNGGNGTFVEDNLSLGDMSELTVTRGIAVGDYDNDGAPDVLANNHNLDAQLFHNEGGARNAWITFRTVGVRSNRDGVGAKIWLTRGGLRQYAEVHSGSSYASHSDMRVTFGLGQAEKVEQVRIRWPSGREETVKNLAARRFYILTEGKGAAVDTRVRPLHGHVTLSRREQEKTP